MKLPRERKAHLPPPLAEHVERVAEHLPRHHVLPFLVIDECGPRVGELETAQVGDLDEQRRASVSAGPWRRTTATATWTCPTICSPRSCRPSRPARTVTWKRRSFPASMRPRCAPRSPAPARPQGHRTSPRMDYAAAEARSLQRTGSLADVAELLGDSKRVAAEHYVYALTDYREADRSIALKRARM